MLEAKEELNSFAKYVIKQSRRRLTQGKSTTNDTKKLYKSLDYELKVSKNSFAMSFYMENYGKFRDKGVSGTEKKYNTKFKYKHSSNLVGVEYHTKALSQWAKRKGVQFRDKKGKYITHRQTGYMLANIIKKKGIKPSMFFTKPFEDSFKRLPDELIEKYGLDVDKFLTTTLDNGINKL